MSIIPHQTGDEAECRICFESHSTHEDPLISPCLCNGTSKWVHKSCIQHWRDVNRETSAFSKCRECGYAYNIKKKYPQEIYVYRPEQIGIILSPRSYWLFFGCGMLMAAVMRPVDKFMKYPSLYIISNFEPPTRNLTDFFNQHEIYNFQYSFCTIVFCFTIMAYIGTFIKTTRHIKNKCRYWRRAGLQYFIILVISLHLYYFGLICHGNPKHVEGLITLETLLSSMNVLFFGTAMVSHNRVINILNTETLGELQNIGSVV